MRVRSTLEQVLRFQAGREQRLTKTSLLSVTLLSLSLQTLHGVYYKCPCERGLTCEGDKSIIGSITNTNYGICLDTGRAKQ